MSDLSKLIEEWGNKVISTEDSHALKDMYDRSSLDDDSVRTIVKNFSKIRECFMSLDKIAKEQGVGTPVSKLENLDEDDHQCFMALGIIDHDVRNLANVFAETTGLIEDALEFKMPEWINKTLDDNTTYTNYENMRILLSSIAHLATHNPKYLMPVQTIDIPNLLERMAKYEMRSTLHCKYSFKGFDKICSEHYVIIEQVVKNALANLDELKKSYSDPDAVDDTIELMVEKCDKYCCIKIRDHGTGIPKDVLSKIFTSYSSKAKGGLGLRIVEKIVHGYGSIKVRTALEGDETYRFDTESKEVNLANRQRDDHGTTFEIRFPCEYDCE